MSYLLVMGSGDEAQPWEIKTMDTSHLNALEIGLSHERVRLANAKTPRERASRASTVAMREREIAWERKSLGFSDIFEVEMSDDELLAELLA